MWKFRDFHLNYTIEIQTYIHSLIFSTMKIWKTKKNLFKVYKKMRKWRRKKKKLCRGFFAFNWMSHFTPSIMCECEENHDNVNCDVMCCCWCWWWWWSTNMLMMMMVTWFDFYLKFSFSFIHIVIFIFLFAFVHILDDISSRLFNCNLLVFTYS